MEEPTLKDLQKELVALGMAEDVASKFQSKGQAQATIDMLSANKKVEAPTASVTAAIDPKEEKAIDKGWETKRAIMARKLDAQPKVQFMFPLAPKETKGVVRTVIQKGIKEYIYVSGAVEYSQLNGYLTIWPKGVRITDMPQQVADNFAEAMNMTEEAGSNMLITRTDTETGRPVSEQL